MKVRSNCKWKIRNKKRFVVRYKRLMLSVDWGIANRPLDKKSFQLVDASYIFYGFYPAMESSSVVGIVEDGKIKQVAILANQKPLGAEFEKVLYDNLWGLYEE